MIRWHQMKGQPRASWLATWDNWQKKGRALAAAAQHGGRVVDMTPETQAERSMRLERDRKKETDATAEQARLESEVTYDPAEARRAIEALDRSMSLPPAATVAK